MHLTRVLLAFWANAFEHKIGTLHQIAFGQLNFRNGQFFKTNGLSASFTMEMNMHVVVYSMVVAVAELIAHAFTVFKHMYEVLFLEECQSTEDARFVDATDAVFQLCHREGTASLGQGLGHDDTIGGRLDAVLFQQ